MKTPSTVTEAPENHTKVRAKLPKLTLKSFGGNPIEWEPFWDFFKSAVDSNPEPIDEVDKFNYLKSLLEGTAARAISGFSLTQANIKRL